MAATVLAGAFGAHGLGVGFVVVPADPRAAHGAGRASGESRVRGPAPGATHRAELPHRLGGQLHRAGHGRSGRLAQGGQ